jgi:hypothetical protein
MKQINLKLTEKQLEDLEKLSNAMDNKDINRIKIAITKPDNNIIQKRKKFYKKLLSYLVGINVLM